MVLKINSENEKIAPTYVGIINVEKSMYYLICDTEVMFYGTKNECREYFNSLKNPMRMKLIRVASEKELSK